MKKIFKSIINGDLLFGEIIKFNNILSARRRIKQPTKSNHLNTIKKVTGISEVSKNNNIIRKDRSSFMAPTGYVYTRLLDVNMEELSRVHKISFDYLRAGGDLFVKNIILNKSGQIVNIYHNGENKVLEILKDFENQIVVRLEECSGAIEEYKIKNGELL